MIREVSAAVRRCEVCGAVSTHVEAATSHAWMLERRKALNAAVQPERRWANKWGSGVSFGHPSLESRALAQMIDAAQFYCCAHSGGATHGETI